MPAAPSIGTRIGARNAHLALALATARLRIATTNTSAAIIGPCPNPSDLMNSPPAKPITSARFDARNHASACPAKNASTMYVPIDAIDSVMRDATQRSERISPLTAPYATPGARKSTRIIGMIASLHAGTIAVEPWRSTMP